MLQLDFILLSVATPQSYMYKFASQARPMTPVKCMICFEKKVETHCERFYLYITSCGFAQTDHDLTTQHTPGIGRSTASIQVLPALIMGKLSSALTLSAIGYLFKSFKTLGVRSFDVEGREILLRALQEPVSQMDRKGKGKAIVEEGLGSGVIGADGTRMRRGIVTGEHPFSG